MIQSDWDYTRHDLDTAQASMDEGVLCHLSQHTSKFVRAMVAGNKHCPYELRKQLVQDTSRGVLGWLIGNPSLTKDEFADIFAKSRAQGYCSVVTQALASSKLATTDQLHQLAHENTWTVTMCILNNHLGRGDDYTQLIKRYEAKPDIEYKQWTEIEKLAYFRITGNRIPREERGP